MICFLLRVAKSGLKKQLSQSECKHRCLGYRERGGIEKEGDKEKGKRGEGGRQGVRKKGEKVEDDKGWEGGRIEE